MWAGGEYGKVGTAPADEDLYDEFVCITTSLRAGVGSEDEPLDVTRALGERDEDAPEFERVGRVGRGSGGRGRGEVGLCDVCEECGWVRAEVGEGGGEAGLFEEGEDGGEGGYVADEFG